MGVSERGGCGRGRGVAGGWASGGFGRVAACRRSAQAPLSGRYLSFAEREEIALLRATGCGVREIARQFGRSPSTISRELRRNAATRGGQSGLPRLDRAVACRPARAAPEAGQARRQRRGCATTCRTGCPGWCSGRTGARSPGPEGPVDRPSNMAARKDRRWAQGVEPGADLCTGCVSTSPMMSRCGSLTRRSTSRSMSRAAARCAAS